MNNITIEELIPFFKYWFDDILWNYNDCTKGEKEILTLEQFNKIKELCNPKEKIILTTTEIYSIFNKTSDKYTLIHKYFEFVECNENMSKFKAICKRNIDNKYFIFNWYNFYDIDYNFKVKEFELTEVSPIEKTIIVYE